MSALFRFLVQYETLGYLILSVGAVFAARSLWVAWTEWHSAAFNLEKELSFQKVRTFGAVFILLIMIGLSQFCLISFVVPFLPSITFRATATADLLQTPSSMTLQPGHDQPGQVGTPAVPTGSDGCSPGQIVISSPKAGEQLQGKIILSGTVNVPNFGFYKYEYASRGSDTWATIAAGDKLKKEEDLGAWDTSQLVPGDYQIRLLVTDNLGKLMPACIISVQVIAP